MDVIARGEVAEAQIEAFISRRDEKRWQSEGERDQEALWAASVARYHEKIRRQNRWEWVRYFDRQAAAHAAIAEDYRERAEALIGGGAA